MVQIKSDIPKWLDKEQRRDSNSAHWSQNPKCYLTPWNHHFYNFISRKVCLWFGPFHSLIHIMPVQYCLDHFRVQPQSHSQALQGGRGGQWKDLLWVVQNVHRVVQRLLWVGQRPLGRTKSSVGGAMIICRWYNDICGRYRRLLAEQTSSAGNTMAICGQCKNLWVVFKLAH